MNYQLSKQVENYSNLKQVKNLEADLQYNVTHENAKISIFKWNQIHDFMIS